MVGLEYICKLQGKQYKILAEELGVSKMALNSWINNKYNIAQEHLLTLEKIFNIPREYFQKKLTIKDKINILDIYREQLILLNE